MSQASKELRHDYPYILGMTDTHIVSTLKTKRIQVATVLYDTKSDTGRVILKTLRTAMRPSLRSGSAKR
jgi:hypothetical protein